MRPEGVIASELIGEHVILSMKNGEVIRETIYWPKKTVFRHLKTLIQKNHVEKIPDPKNSNARGRPASRYRLNPNKRLVVKWPVRRFGRMWFPAVLRTKAFSGKTFPRTFGKWKKEFEEYKTWLKEHDPQEYEKCLKLERRKKRRY